MDHPASHNRKRSRGLFALSVVGLCIAMALSYAAGAYVEKSNAPPPPPVQPLSGNALRLMTYNVRIDSSSDGDNSWSHRRDMVASVIRFHQADIIGAQEASFSMIDDLQTRLPGYRWVGTGSNGGDSGACDPIFWRTSRLELLNNRTYWLSETPDEPSTGWDAAYPRTVTYTHLRERQTGAEIHVFNTHFDHRGGEARGQSIELVAQWVNNLPDDAHVVFMGDLNLVPDSGELQTLAELSQLRDAYTHSLTGNHGASNSFMGFRPSRWTGRRIDHIFVQNLIVQQHAILNDEFDGRRPSDHYPVVAEVLFE
ncbi:MAG: endonuclease/exonuclease/phosphatase family protein [Planctomycetes bacterium]|nr:endonuclease/exonuclease/phosphatase family protein [Planctomycetota bacterium]MCA8937379.1 endonuclease/exonuclease/phosphatase family protein [Planctomycetota bacterium]